MEWIGMLRLGVRRAVRNWKLSLAIFIGLVFVSTLFAGINVHTNLIQQSLLGDQLANLPADMIWHRSSRYPDEIEVPTSQTLRQWEDAITSVPHVMHTDFYIVHYPPQMSAPGDIYYTTAIQHNSSVYDEISIVAGPPSLGVNETYIATSSARFNDYPIGSNFTLQFMNRGFGGSLLNATVRVVGYVDLTRKGRRLLTGESFFLDPLEHFPTFFIIDYEQTSLPLLDVYRMLGPEEPNLRIHISITVNRNALLNPYNIAGSISQVYQVANQIHNRLRIGSSWIENLLGGSLLNVQNTLQQQHLTYFLLALPVLFITLYIGITLGDVTFTLRRKEIGLLLAKTATPRQLKLLYLVEALFIGFIAGTLGLVLSVLVVSLLAGSGTILTAISFLGWDTVILVLGLAGFLGFLSIYLPARKAIKIPLADAMREYSVISEQIQYRKKLAWLCLILGTYQLLIWIFNLNIYLTLTAYSTGNLLIQFLKDLWLDFNLILGIVAPLLFTYGFVTLVVKGTPSLITRISQLQHRLFGDIGNISAHNIQRRPGRTAAVIFLLALLLAFSIQSLGHLASSYDWTHRRIYADVGADVRVQLQHPDNVTTLLPVVRGLDGVQGATAQFVLSMQIDTSVGNELRAITVDEWLEVAHYEDSWFPSGSAESTLRTLNERENGLVFEYKKALQFGTSRGSSIGIRVWPNRTIQDYIVTGFFGPRPIEYSQPDWLSYSAEWTWSYTTTHVLDSLNSSSGYSSYLLIRLTNVEANSNVRDALLVMNGVLEVISAIDRINEFHTNLYLSAQTTIIGLVVVFAYILTATGTCLIFYLGLLERRRITTLMCQRGGSYRQLVRILASEALFITLLGVILGVFTGVIAYYGVIQGAGFRWPYPMAPFIPYRFMPGPFIPSILLQLLIIIGLLIVIPLIIVLLEVKRAQTDLSILR